MTDEVKLPGLTMHEDEALEVLAEAEAYVDQHSMQDMYEVALSCCEAKLKRDRQLLAALRENATLKEKLSRRESTLDHLMESNAVLLRRAEDVEAKLSKADGWVDVPDRQGWWWHRYNPTDFASFVCSILQSNSSPEPRFFIAYPDSRFCDEIEGQWLWIAPPCPDTESES